MQLRLRLKNCLQTILELKDDIGSMPFGSSFADELGALEDFLEKLSGIAVNEYEVQRVELATAKFLQELTRLLFAETTPKTSVRLQ